MLGRAGAGGIQMRCSRLSGNGPRRGAIVGARLLDPAENAFILP